MALVAGRLDEIPVVHECAEAHCQEARRQQVRKILGRLQDDGVLTTPPSDPGDAVPVPSLGNELFGQALEDDEIFDSAKEQVAQLMQTRQSTAPDAPRAFSTNIPYTVYASEVGNDEVIAAAHADRRLKPISGGALVEFTPLENSNKIVVSFVPLRRGNRRGARLTFEHEEKVEDGMATLVVKVQKECEREAIDGFPITWRQAYEIEESSVNALFGSNETPFCDASIDRVDRSLWSGFSDRTTVRRNKLSESDAKQPNKTCKDGINEMPKAPLISCELTRRHSEIMAAFAHDQLRLHTLASAANGVSKRLCPLLTERAQLLKLATQPNTESDFRYLLSMELHRACCTCICSIYRKSCDGGMGRSARVRLEVLFCGRRVTDCKSLGIRCGVRTHGTHGDLAHHQHESGLCFAKLRMRLVCIHSSPPNKPMKRVEHDILLSEVERAQVCSLCAAAITEFDQIDVTNLSNSKDAARLSKILKTHKLHDAKPDPSRPSTDKLDALDARAYELLSDRSARWTVQIEGAWSNKNDATLRLKDTALLHATSAKGKKRTLKLCTGKGSKRPKDCTLLENHVGRLFPVQ